MRVPTLSATFANATFFTLNCTLRQMRGDKQRQNFNNANTGFGFVNALPSLAQKLLRPNIIRFR